MTDTDKILEFCQTCGADPPLAQKYLMIANDDLHHAISLFLDLDGADLPDDTIPATSSIPTIAHPRIPNALPYSTTNVSQYIDEVAADSDDEEEVDNEQPAPSSLLLNSTRPVLPPSALRSASTAFNPFSQSSSGRRYPANNDAPTQMTDRQSRLMELYRPPRELMYHGTFENAKETGRMEKKWLIVDVNDDTYFACQILNRDIWKNKPVIEVIKELFLFLQIDKHSEMGKQFVALYPVTQYPHVCLIDPRTGERVKHLSKTQLESPGALMEALYEFLDRHSLTSMTLPSRYTETTGSSPSLVQQHQDNVIVLDNSDSEYNMPTDSHPVGGAESLIASCLALTDSEPRPEALDTCRIQIRFPDGTRLVRRFFNHASVLDLYRAVKAARPDTDPSVTDSAHKFELVFVRQNLADCLQRTLSEMGLANASLTMNYV